MLIAQCKDWRLKYVFSILLHSKFNYIYSTYFIRICIFDIFSDPAELGLIPPEVVAGTSEVNERSFLRRAPQVRSKKGKQSAKNNYQILMTYKFLQSSQPNIILIISLLIKNPLTEKETYSLSVLVLQKCLHLSKVQQSTNLLLK